MATATKIVVTPKPITEITLKLSEDEAKFLMSVLHRIGGNPRDSRRRFSRPITSALSSVVEYDPHKDRDISSTQRAIWFNDEVK